MKTAIYSRVSTTGQDTKSQDRELKLWATTQTDEMVYYKDKATGTNFNRPGMERLLKDIRARKIDRVVVWRLDRLGRTAKGMLDFFEELEQFNCGFLSLRDSIDLSTPSGRLLLIILAGVAAFETEVRSERQRAGIEACRAANNGKAGWGGREVGMKTKRIQEKEELVHLLNREGKSVAEIARKTDLGRQTVYRLLANSRT